VRLGFGCSFAFAAAMKASNDPLRRDAKSKNVPLGHADDIKLMIV
jgi:hypothetical protein